MVAARVPGRDVAQVERRGRQLLGSDWNGPLQNDLGSTAAQAPRFGHVLPPPRRPLTAMEMLLQVSAPHPSPRARSIRDLLEPSSIRVPPVLPPARIPQAASGSNRPPRTTPRAKRGRGTGHDTPESELSDVSDDPSVVVECISDRDNDGELSADSQEVDIGSAAQVAHIAGPLPKTIVLAPLPTALLLPQRRRFKSSLLDPLSPPPASRNHAAATAAAAAEPPRSRPIFPPLPPPPIPLLPIKSKPPARQRRVSEPNKPAGRKRRAVLVASSDENDDEMEHDSGTSQDDHSDRPLPRTVSKRRRTLSTQSHLTESTHHHAPMDVNPPSTVLDPFMLIPLQDELDPPPLRVTVDPIPLV
ncbi:hypothetical protein BC828DRAFT_289414 [Blastocladiella britannica]|nr:hypothetical protein BC828DRAFT_289414 [Blastocladiella britannica]